jgi:hypothetical protein
MIRWSFVPLVLALAACGGGGDRAATAVDPQAEMGPYGPPMGATAEVVRSASIETTGAVSGTFTGTSSEGTAGLMGLCNPNTFANFLIKIGDPGGKEVWAGIMSKREVGTGATGDFRLDYLEITFRDMSGDNFSQRDFRGPATLTITTHDAAPGARHMVGSIVGTGLEGRDDEAGKTIDATVRFDMDFSCGVTGAGK